MFHLHSLPNFDVALSQVFVWGEYFPGRIEYKPSGIQLSSNLYVMNIAAGDCITMACAYLRNRPKIYVVDENKCLQTRENVLSQQPPRRLYQGLACVQNDSLGHVLVVVNVNEDTNEKFVEERNAIHNLNFNVLNQMRHLYNLRRQFSLKWRSK